MAGLVFPARGRPPTPWSPSSPALAPMEQEAIPALPITPPDSVQSTPNLHKPDRSPTGIALHVIATERAGLAYLENFYRTDPAAQVAVSQAVDQIVSTSQRGGKLIVTGVGKSGKIAQKIEATFKSLGIDAVFLSPSEALHGDLGSVKGTDTIVMISFSGRTPELFALLPHISESVPIIALSSATHPSACPLLASRRNSLLLPTPIHESEKTSFGISSPTTSATVALVLGDGLALAAADKLHTALGKSSADIFHSNHPGGAIGAAQIPSDAEVVGPIRISQIAVSVDDVHVAPAKSGQERLSGLDILRTAVRSDKGWVRLSPIHILSPRRIQRLPMESTIELDHPDVVEKQDWISILGSYSLEEAKEWIIHMRKDERGRTFLKQGTILGIVDERNEVSRVVEIEDVVGELELQRPPA